jgi:hypothetical protein
MKNKVKIENWFSEMTIRTNGGNAEIDPKRIIRAQICGGDTLVVSLELPLAKGQTTYWIKFGPQTEQIIEAIKDRVEITTS